MARLCVEANGVIPNASPPETPTAQILDAENQIGSDTEAEHNLPKIQDFQSPHINTSIEETSIEVRTPQTPPEKARFTSTIGGAGQEMDVEGSMGSLDGSPDVNILDLDSNFDKAHHDFPYDETVSGADSLKADVNLQEGREKEQLEQGNLISPTEMELQDGTECEGDLDPSAYCSFASESKGSDPGMGDGQILEQWPLGTNAKFEINGEGDDKDEPFEQISGASKWSANSYWELRQALLSGGVSRDTAPSSDLTVEREQRTGGVSRLFGILDGNEDFQRGINLMRVPEGPVAEGSVRRSAIHLHPSIFRNSLHIWPSN